MKIMKEKIFDSLVKNGFDYLQQAINEFDASPKYSVIHFCSAIEVLLKARLMQEHWTLVISKPEQANLNSFKNGDFQSVTIKDIYGRLNNIVGEDIGKNVFASFDALAKHRNKLIHFYHDDIKDNHLIKDQIISEQCYAWFYLYELLKRWKDNFKNFAIDIEKANKGMQNHRKYLEAKFIALNEKIDHYRKKGCSIRACQFCGFESGVASDLIHESEQGVVEKVICLVCERSSIQLTINCLHCNDKLHLIEGYGQCDNCGERIEPDDLVELLGEKISHYDIKHGAELYNANCHSCDGYHTVIQLDDELHFCCNCFNYFDKVFECEYCGDLNTKDMEYSYHLGCNHCDGHSWKDN